MEKQRTLPQRPALGGPRQTSHRAPEPCHRFFTRPLLWAQVLRTPSEELFARALAEGKLDGDELLGLDGLDTCVDADGATVPGGAVLCLTIASASGEGEAEGGAAAAETTIACVAAVLMPGRAGGLAVYAAKEEREGMLALLKGAP